MFSETDMIEFKREFSKTVLKTVVAFANTKGGVIYLGIEDDGTVCGVDDPDGVMLAAMNSIRANVKPNASMVAQCELVNVKGKNVVGIRVERGANRPYYLSEKGMRPEGVYIRQGPASFMASESEIVEMLKASHRDSFEDRRCLRQDLSFNQASAVFAREGVELGDAQMRTLGFVDEDGQFTNLAWLLSDQWDRPIKLASFFGMQRTTFKDRLETSGSLLAQLDQALSFLNEHMHYKTRFVNMRRVDYENFPPDAVREALVNAIIHRDYDREAPTLASVLDDRFEIVSHGGLPAAYSFDEFQFDVSVPRNPKLAAVFYRLRIIEAYGTGIRRMFEAYENDGVAPRFDITKNLFKVTLPNRNLADGAERPSKQLANPGCESGEDGPCGLFAQTAQVRQERNATGVWEGEAAPGSLRDQERMVLEVIDLQGPLKRSEIQQRFEFSQATLLRIIKRLEEKGLVRAEGNTRRRVYYATSG